ncbi:hypothetical protein [Mycobacterium phage WXIN]|nr:hypothetical protein [Mycobacterium phage WXIN]
MIPEVGAVLARMMTDGKVPVVIDGRVYRVHPATAAVLNTGKEMSDTE